MSEKCMVVNIDRIEKTPSSVIDRAIVGLIGVLVPANTFRDGDKAVLISAGTRISVNTAMAATGATWNNNGNTILTQEHIVAFATRDLLLKLIVEDEMLWIPCPEDESGVIGKAVFEGQDVTDLVAV